MRDLLQVKAEKRLDFLASRPISVNHTVLSLATNVWKVHKNYKRIYLTAQFVKLCSHFIETPILGYLASVIRKLTENKLVALSEFFHLGHN